MSWNTCRQFCIRTAFSGLFASGALLSPAHGEVEVSVTLTGPIEEIIPILHLINDLGAGKRATGEPLELQVHSSFPEQAAPAPAAAPDPAPAAPMAAAPTAEPAPATPPPAPLAVLSFAVEPAQAAPGASVTASAAIHDAEGKVDTVAVRVAGVEGVSFELFDNASGGDATAGDGTWTGSFILPAAMAAGGGELVLTAFDAYGDPVDISAKAALTVTGN